MLTPVEEEERAVEVEEPKVVVVVVEAKEPKEAKVPGDQLTRVSLTVGRATSFSKVSVTREMRASTRISLSSPSSQARTATAMTI